ncbi:MAG: hypothetical protein OXT65_07860 [Alphaproteobacteria bacterium]|nr:hypothetical protein [Alphaproteobacteria bacterium]
MKIVSSGPNKGNIIFIILIGIALFAALSFAVTQSGRNSGDMNREKISLEIYRIESYIHQIQQALQRMQVVSNTPEYLIDYSDSAAAAACVGTVAANTTGCTTNDCKMFHPQGGGVETGFIIDSAFHGGVVGYAGCADIWNVTIDDVGQDNQRDMILRFYDVSQKFCLAWNDRYNVNNPGGVPPTDYHDSSYARYQGDMTSQVTLTDATARYDEVNIAGKKSFCIYEWDSYRINYVLKAR